MNAVADCCWICQLLDELQCAISKVSIMFCDNVSAIYMSSNLVHHRCTKHIGLDICFVHEPIALGEFHITQVPIDQKIVDIMTKELPSELFSSFRSSLCIIGNEDV